MSGLLIAAGGRSGWAKAAALRRAAAAAGLSCPVVYADHGPAVARTLSDEGGLAPPAGADGTAEASHTSRTASTMLDFEQILAAADPSVVVLVGSTDAVLACGLVAAKLGVPISSVDAGLRSYDAWAREEINRRLSDQLATYLFTSSRGASGNLDREGMTGEGTFFAGNALVDTLSLDDRRGAPHGGAAGYAVLALRGGGVADDPAALQRVLEAVSFVSRSTPVIFPVDAAITRQLELAGLDRTLSAEPAVRGCARLGYRDFLRLVHGAAIVFTDSGAVQEETTALAVPCLTLRDSTERDDTVTAGTNTLVGTETETIVEEALTALEGAPSPPPRPELWDGHAAQRIVSVLRAAIPA
jgi:UDP-N-acetylglucosamine 2-epimerase (non-hydrolysing)